MKKYLITVPLVIALLSCNKEPQPSKPEYEVSAIEIKAMKNEIEELKAMVQALASLSFEVDGLRFDKNGSLISTPRLESEMTESETILGIPVSLTTTRSLDDRGRLIKEKYQYSNVGDFYKQSLPFVWKELFYEYNGKNCKTTIRTNKFGLPAGVPYEEQVTETTYW